MAKEMPVLFLSHGPGPALLLDSNCLPRYQDTSKSSPSGVFIRELWTRLDIPKPSAVLVLSAHWLESEHTVLTHPTPPLYYDYGGFPDEAYHLTWPVEGAPEQAKRVASLLQQAGIPCQENSNRGLDHGVFVPLGLMFPKADIAVFQVSLKSDLDFKNHAKLGEILAPLRREGVLIIGRGFSTHPSFSNTNFTDARVASFRRWLNDLISNDQYTPMERRQKFLAASSQEDFKEAHSSDDHFLPIVIAAAAAGFTAGEILFEDLVLNGQYLMGHYRFG